MAAPGLVDPGRSLIAEALAGVSQGQDRLLRALAYPGQDRRMLESQGLIRELWHAEPGWGPYPLLEQLSRNQADRVYFRRYRDHLVHMLRVWIQGLYFLGRVDPLRQALLDEVRGEGGMWGAAAEGELLAEVQRRWKAAALWHDLGYVFEIQGSPSVYLDYTGDRAEAGRQFSKMRDELAGYLQGMRGEDALLVWGVTPEKAEPLEDETPSVDPKTENIERWDLVPYLEAVVRECGSITMHGIMSPGKAREATAVPIQEIYAPLRKEGALSDTDLWQELAGLSAGPEQLEQELAAHAGERGPQQRGLLLVGDPGSGKSTFLRMTAAVLAHAGLGQPWALEHPAARAFVQARGEVPLPIFMRLSELSAFVEDSAAEQGYGPTAPGWLVRFLCRQCEGLGVGVRSEVVEAWLRRGRVVVLLDGLDEIPGTRLRQQVGRLVSGALAEGVYGRCRFAVTSRPLQDEPYALPMTPRTLAGLTGEAVETFLQRWAALAGESGGRFEGPEAYAADLLEQSRSAPAAIRRMLRNPLMLTCLAVIHWNEQRLPQQRAELYRAILRWLVRARRRRADGPGTLPEHQVHLLYQTLAMAMHTVEGGRVRELELPAAARSITAFFAGEAPQQADRQYLACRFLEAEVVDSGIITLRGGGKLSFWHLTFQEFLAAERLEQSTEEEWAQVLTRERLYHPEWRETLLLLAGLLRGGSRVRLLLEHVLGPARSGELTVKAGAYGLARAMLSDLEPYGYQPPEELELAALEREVMAIFSEEGRSVPIKRRVEAADALGRAGDPRLGWEDEKHMVLVPQGPFWMGGEDADAMDREKPMRQVTLQAFRILRFPVTAGQFTRFVQGPQYHRDDLWPYGFQQRQDLETDVARWLHEPTRPVTGVNWFEADAFCRWLNTVRSRGDGLVWCLPSEAQWEKAARGGLELAGGESNPAARRVYPWGDAWDETRLNSSVGKEKVRETTPVGLYPTGRGPHGRRRENCTHAGVGA